MKLGEVRKFETFQVTGIAVRTSNKDGKSAQDLGKLWQRFMQEGIAEKVSRSSGPEVYSLYTEYEGGHMDDYTAVIGMRTPLGSPADTGLQNFIVEAGGFQEVPVEGEIPQGVMDTWQAIWQSGIARNFITDFEVYSDQGVTIHLGIATT